MWESKIPYAGRKDHMQEDVHDNILYYSKILQTTSIPTRGEYLAAVCIVVMSTVCGPGKTWLRMPAFPHESSETSGKPLNI